MSGLFGKAMKDATFSVTTSSDGARTFSKDNDKSSDYRGGYRGRNNRGRGRGRGGRGGSNWRGGRRGYGGRGRSQSHSAGPRTYLDDEDESMDDDIDGGKPHSSRYTPYGARPPSRRGFQQDDNTNKSDVKSRLGHVGGQFQSKSSWYKVSVVNGKEHNKDWLLKRIQNSCEEAFQPVDFHYMGDSALFFVDSKAAADALKRTSHKITVKNGSKIIISVRPSDPPRTAASGAGPSSNISLNHETLQALKECLSNRYDVGTKLMNLSDLYNDDVLKANNVQGHIYKTYIAQGILKLIGENCQDMEGLDLSDNRLFSVDSLKDIANFAPSIKYLKLSNNQFKNIDELDKLKGLSEVQTLDLTGNPLCDKFESDISYINAVRIRFPKVIVLDGTQHKPPIGFEIAATTALPKVQESYLNQPAIKEIVITFLEQYFKIFDSSDRQPLLEAYHEQAMFSLCTNTGMIANREKGPHTFGKDKGPRGPSLGEYMKMSRNMLRRKEAEQRASLIKTNRLSVVAMLNELPATTHDLSTFIIDISFAVQSCLSFAIRGLFMEANKTLRSFSRVFVAVPGGNDGKSLRIVNDELHIRSPTLSQIQAFQKKRAASAATQAEPSTASLSTAKSSANVLNNLTPEQQQMVRQFSRESKMNTEWSYRCLSQNNWDYQKAAGIFTDLNSKGSIPADAFLTT